MKVRDVMTRDLVTVEPSTSFKDVVHLLLSHDISGVPVVWNGELVGIISETDLISKEAFEGEDQASHERPLRVLSDALHGDLKWTVKAEATDAAGLMTEDVATVGADDDLRDAALVMLRRKVTRLPVIEHGRLVGILTRRDLLRIFDRSDEEIGADIDRYLHDPLYAPDEHDVTATVEDGVVRLTGHVPYESDKRAVEVLIARVPGVVSVENRIVANQPAPARPAVKGPTWPDPYAYRPFRWS